MPIPQAQNILKHTACGQTFDKVLHHLLPRQIFVAILAQPNIQSIFLEKKMNNKNLKRNNHYCSFTFIAPSKFPP
jgi:hypothetical protein